jgi:hypothetical protein
VTRVLIPLTTLLLLVLAACGDEGSHDRTRTEAQQMVGEAPDPVVDVEAADLLVTVALTEYEIQLDRDTIPAGSVRFRVRNNGSEPHALQLAAAGQIHRTAAIEPGHWTVLDVELGPGRYEVVCPVEDGAGVHADRGMQNWLVVVDGGTSMQPADAGR